MATNTGNVTIIPDSALIPSNYYYTDLIGGGIGTAMVPTGSTISRNDDASQGPIPLGFTLSFFGNSYSSFYLNNNGNISFNEPIAAFTPSGLQGAQEPIISPFFADVDTRGEGSGLVYYRTDIPNEVIITWDQVGYYGAHSDKLDSFQLVIRGPGYAIPAGEGAIGFFYKSMQWETGDASGGSGGFGGTPAAVGFGDGSTNGEVLQGSTQNGISRILNDEHIWFDANLAPITGTSYAIAATDANHPDSLTGTTNYTFTITRSGDTSGSETLAYSIAGSGTNPAPASQFASPTSGTVAFNPGDSSVTLTVAVNGGAITAPEGFTVSLASPDGASISTASADGVIGPNTQVSGPASYVAPTQSVQPTISATGTSNYTFTLYRVGNFAARDTLTWQIDTTSAGLTNAADPILFPASSGTVVFTPGSTSATFTVPVNGAFITSTEQFYVDLLQGGVEVLPPLQVTIGQNYPTSSGSGTALVSVSQSNSGATSAVPTQSDAILINPTTAAVARFFDKTTGAHFYTASVTEQNNVLANLPSLVAEGNAFGAVAPGAAASDAASVPVYRFFDLTYGTHFYTDSSSERDAVQQTRTDLVYEGIGFYEHSTQQAGDVPVYRLFDGSNGTHVYTESQTELNQIAATRPDMRLEGVAFYAPQLG